MKPFEMTTWVNPTKHTQTFDLFEGPGEIHKIVIPPGGKESIPAKYDQAIRTERDGVVVAGLAPMLVPEGRESVPVHQAIGASAAAGDAERKLESATGTTAGGLTLDAAAALQAQLETVMAELAALKAYRMPPQQEVSGAAAQPPVPPAPSSPQPQPTREPRPR